MKTARACLPLPPSANALFANRRKATIKGKQRGRIITQEYDRWRTEAGLRLNMLHLPHIGGPVELDIQLPATMRGDISNRIKALEDLLVSHGRIDDDKNVWKITVERVEMLIEEARVSYSTAAGAR